MSYPRGMPFADELDCDGWDHATGMPTYSMIGNAIQVWATFQGRDRVTVRECGEAFNLDDAQVREAVTAHPWMYLAGADDLPTEQTIEHEGE